jgi:two-component system, OmpR family, sensor histidine kinase KdpD
MRSRTLRRVLSLSIAMAAVVAATAVGRWMDLNANTMGFAYLIVVLVASLRGGLAAGLLASIVATLCYNFFFFSPLYTFVIHDAANWVALAAFLITSVVVSRLVLVARIQADRAEQRRKELQTLYDLSVDLFSAADRLGSLGSSVGRALTVLGTHSGGVVLFDGQGDSHEFGWWSGDRTQETDEAIAAVRHRNDPVEVPSPAGRDVYVPITIPGRTIGALAARGTYASRQALVSAAHLVGLAVERDSLIQEHAHIEALRESDTLKTSLLRAISHDLSTPLTAITIHTQTLRRKAPHDEDLEEAISGIADESARLHRRIDNLLAMARLEAGKAKPRPEPTPPADLFHAVRENLPLIFARRPVVVRVEDDCPDANVDPSLTLEVLVNLVENADRVSPHGAPVELVARTHPFDPGRVRIEVLDRGPGLPHGVTDADGNVLPGATSDEAQRGLGLQIARSLAAANGGSVGLTQRDGGGTIARLDVPAARKLAEQWA